VIAGDRMTYTEFGKSLGAWRIHLEEGKSPKVFDLQGLPGPTNGRVRRGVYRLEGDTLTICCRLSADEKNRPTGFDVTQPGVHLQVFRRKKP
jgi:uncharacterized protein (TIGR03067 family)